MTISDPRSRKSALIGHLGASLCIIMWGVSFISSKALLENGLGPVEIYVYRFTLAYFVILLFKHDRIRSNSWRDEGLLALCGLLGGSIYFIAENTALRYTLVSNVSLLTSLSPLITMLLVGLIYKNQRPSSGMVTGSFVAFFGVACVIFNSSFVLKVNPLGDILSLAAAFSWAVYSLILKQLNADYDVWFITRKTFFYGVITALPFMAFEPSVYNPLYIFKNPEVWGNILFLGLGASLIAYVLWASTVKHVGAMKANIYMYFQPIVTLVASAFLINEHVTIVGYIGCGTILLGVWLGDYLSRPKKI